MAVTGGDQRLAVALNATACTTTEAGGSCDVIVAACAHGEGNTACASPFLQKPLFVGGVTRVVVELSLDDRTEAVAPLRTALSVVVFRQLRGHDRPQRRQRQHGLQSHVVFEPYDDEIMAAANDMQGPYYATVTVEGMPDWLADGTQPVEIKVDSTQVMSEGESPKIEMITAAAGMARDGGRQTRTVPAMVARGVTYDDLTVGLHLHRRRPGHDHGHERRGGDHQPKFSFEMEPKCTACSNSGKTPAF